MNTNTGNLSAQSSYRIWLQLVKDGMVSIPVLLFRNYASLAISEEQMMLLLHIYIFQNHENIDFPTISQLEDRMAINHHQIMVNLQALIKKGFITIDELAIHGIRSEIYNLDPLFERLFAILTEEEKAESKGTQPLLAQLRNRDIFTAFEQEFGRPLSPLECESITIWLDQDDLPEELVIAALKEAVFAGKLSFRYIDRILFEWQRQNIRTLDEAKRHAAQFRGQAANHKNTQKSEQDKKLNFKIFNWLDESQSK